MRTYRIPLQLPNAIFVDYTVTLLDRDFDPFDSETLDADDIYIGTDYFDER